MAYENGYEIEDYFGGTIENYRKDNMIFTKALTVINTYLNRPDWPHCFEELEETLFSILGGSVITIGFQGFYLEDQLMEWPPNTPQSFKENAISFYKTVRPIVMQYYFNRLEPLKLYSIVATQNDFEKDKSLVRFIRNDGKQLEVEVDRYAIEEAIKVLSQLLESSGNE